MFVVEIEGSALRRLRRALRDSASELGAKTGTTARQIYRIETGACRTSLQFLDRLAQVVGADRVAALILAEDARADFLAAHDGRASDKAPEAAGSL